LFDILTAVNHLGLLSVSFFLKLSIPYIFFAAGTTCRRCTLIKDDLTFMEMWSDPSNIKVSEDKI